VALLKDWWRRRTLRARLMIIGVIGLTLGFVAGGLALAGVLGIVLQRTVDAEIEVTADHVAALVEADALPVPVPVAAGNVVQVIDPAGRVVGASAVADPLKPMFSPEELARLRAGERLTIHDGLLGVRGGPLRVVAVQAGPADDPRTVVVARSMADVTRGLELLRTLLLVVFPLLLLASAALAWRVIGAALRSVEQLRRGAEEISGSSPRATARLPVPSSDDEIRRLAVTINGMLDRLEASRARQREFVADAAHELRSPLANMRAQLEVARHLGPAADWPVVGEDLLTDTTRLARLVDDLLVLARADAGPHPSRPARAEPVDLAAIAGEVATRMTDGVGVTVAGDAPVWTVGDADELRRVVGNLVDNAVRYARTTVELAVVADAGTALLTVTDDGPGIPAADRQRVFERFTRLDDSRTNATGGAGLGLAIVRELVRRHLGTVTLADATHGDPSHGLRVEVRLPFAPDVEPGWGLGHQ
jgi:signal transduction histidine kinase